jgi:protein-S-isoprenylcysteine O-methyltransferase Ste14
MLNIGESLHVGLPEGNTTLKTGGLYRFSRNPIYVAVYLISLSAMAYTFNPIGIFLGLYCIVIHHMIVLSEEEFLKKRFGKDYIEYCGKVRRYI